MLRKVIHRHRAGGRVFCRVSELTIIDGKPSAIIRSVDLGGVYAPLFTVALDPALLRQAAGAPHIAFYAGETRDPRYDGPPSCSSTISAQAR